MTFIIDKKTYDTDKAELVLEYYESYPMALMPTLRIEKITKLFRTTKGNWFSVRKGDYDRYYAEKQTSENVQNIFSRKGKIELYNKYFDALEEA